MAITTLDQIINKLSGQKNDFLKGATSPKGAGSYHSYWQVAGSPIAGVAPSFPNGTLYTSSNSGAIKFTNASAGNTLYLAGITASINTAITLIIYDRLWSNSGLSGTTITAQTWTEPTLTRNSTGEGVEAWIEFYGVNGGATAVDATLTYTNSSGVSGRSAIAKVISTPVPGQIIQFSLQEFDTGIQTASQVILSASSGTAGNFGITLLKRIAMIPVPASNSGITVDHLSLGLPIIENNSALGFIALASAIPMSSLVGTLSIIEG